VSGHVVPLRGYLAVFGSLLVLTGITVGVAFVDLGAFGVPVALGIAGLKATLVVLYFMHVRWSTHLLQLFVVAGFLWLGLLIGLTLLDFRTRHRVPVYEETPTPQFEAIAPR